MGWRHPFSTYALVRTYVLILNEWSQFLLIVFDSKEKTFNKNEFGSVIDSNICICRISLCSNVSHVPNKVFVRMRDFLSFRLPYNLTLCVCVCVCVCLFVLHPLLCPGFKLWIQIDQANFTNCISFLPSNLIEISPNPEAFSANT